MGGRLISAGISATLLVVSVGLAAGQSVISARSGLVHYVEGQAAIDDKTVDVKYSQFPEIKENQVFKTEEGRAEVLLNPGVFLRVSENSSFKMISNRLSDTRVEALTGTLMVEYGEVSKDHHVTLLFRDRNITFSKGGLYRLDAGTGAFRVYQGEARIAVSGQTLVAKQAKEVMLDAPVLTAMKFDNKDDDEFYRWASRRAGYLALANISAAKSLQESGWNSSSAYGSGMWRWNPYFGMFTYVPFGGMYMSPFGYSFYTPLLISGFYAGYPGYYNNYGGYYSGGGGGGAAAAATRTSVNYGAPTRPTSMSSTGGSGMVRGGGASAGGFGGHDGGFRGAPSYSGSYGGGSSGGYSGGSVASSGSSGSSGGGAVSSGSSGGGGGGHAGSAGGHGR